MKQNSDNMRLSSIGQIKLFWITAHMGEFNLSHMPNPLDTIRIKQKLCEGLIQCAPIQSGASWSSMICYMW